MKYSLINGGSMQKTINCWIMEYAHRDNVLDMYNTQIMKIAIMATEHDLLYSAYKIDKVVEERNKFILVIKICDKYFNKLDIKTRKAYYACILHKRTAENCAKYLNKSKRAFYRGYANLRKKIYNDLHENGIEVSWI